MRALRLGLGKYCLADIDEIVSGKEQGEITPELNTENVKNHVNRFRLG